jgi:microsomal prostaglandin-E synthase 2
VGEPSPPALTPAAVETAWRRWVDGRLVRVLTLNIYRTAREAWQAFDYITEAGDFGGPVETGAARVVGAAMMWGIAGRLAKKYGILEGPRDALASVGKEWVDGALGGGARPFAGGEAGPDLADLSAFGVWRAVRGTDTFAAAMDGNAELGAWYARMEGVVGPSARVEGGTAAAAAA